MGVKRLKSANVKTEDASTPTAMFSGACLVAEKVFTAEYAEYAET